MKSRIQFDFSDTTTVVTGGASGIGLATAELIARSGGDVIVTASRNQAKTEKALKQIREASRQGGRENAYIEAFPYEAEKEDSVRDFFENIQKTSKRVDYLVHGIAVSPDTDFDKQDAKLWNSVLATNVTGSFLAMKYVREIMKTQDVIDEVRGKILLITSTNGVDSYGIFSAPYDASKAAMINMVRNMGEHFHNEDKIVVNGIGPGWVNTGMNDSVPPEDMAKEMEKVWSGRQAEPNEIAQNILAYLTLPYNSGRDHMVDGGYR